MCMLCSEELVKKLNIQEIRRAGMELIHTSDPKEVAHILGRIVELEDELEEEVWG